MQILHASISEIADTFLHPGYMSAYVEITAPVAMTAAIVPVDKAPTMQIDMAKALQLTPALNDPGAGLTTPEPHPVAPVFPWVAIVVVLVVMALSHRFAGARPRPRRAPRLTVAIAALGTIIAGACDSPRTDPTPQAAVSASGPREAPKQEPSLIPFVDPQQATIAILNGLVADALACSRAPEVTSLAVIREQVGLPFTNKTAGMRYAIANYEDDGWARPFRLRAQGKAHFEVASAGPDGEFDTADDISTEVRRPDNLEWPSKLRGFYLRRERSDAGVAFHRCGPEGTRRTRVDPTARGLVGDAVYGVLQEREFPESKRKAIRERLDQAVGNAKDGLVLVVFKPGDMGRPTLRKIEVPDW